MLNLFSFSFWQYRLSISGPQLGLKEIHDWMVSHSTKINPTKKDMSNGWQTCMILPALNFNDYQLGNNLGRFCHKVARSIAKQYGVCLSVISTLVLGLISFFEKNQHKRSREYQIGHDWCIIRYYSTTRMGGMNPEDMCDHIFPSCQPVSPNRQGILEIQVFSANFSIRTIMLL